MAVNLVSYVTYEDFKLNNTSKLRNSQIVTDIVSRKTCLVNIVECIGKVLTDDNKDIRNRGVQFLTWILSSLPEDQLNEKEIKSITAFYCERLKDHHSLLPGVIKGIFSVVKFRNASDSTISEILHNLFQFVVCQSQLAEDRYTIYGIVKECTLRHLPSIQSVGPDFLYGFITSMEGETDPKNLLLIFSFLPYLLSRLDNIDHLTTDVFEVFSTYFPVDFTSVEKDGVCITRNDLAKGLIECLACTPALSAECLPLILEKLDSSLKSAKIDSYRLLQKCCGKVNNSQLESSLNALWKMIQRDLIPPGSEQVQEEALLTVTAIVSALAKNKSSKVELDRFLDDVIISVRSLLPKPCDSLFVPSMKILQALCPGSNLAAKRVFLELESLCKIEQLTAKETQSLLEALLPMLPYFNNAEKSSDVIARLCIRSAEHPCEDVRNIAFVSLQRIISYVLEDEKRCLLYEALLKAIQFQSTKSLGEYYKLLGTIAEIHKDSFNEEYMLRIQKMFVDGNLPANQFFDVLGSLLDVPTVTSQFVPFILNHVTCEGQSDAALHALLSCCRTSKRHEFFVSLVSEHDVIITLINECVAAVDLSKLSTVALILIHIVPHLDKSTQESLTAAVMTDQLKVIEAISKDSNKVILLEGLLGGLRQDVYIPLVKTIFPQLLDIAKTSDYCEARLSASRLLAAFVNKFDDVIGIQLIDEVRSALAEQKGGQQNVVALLSWLVKGAILKNYVKYEDHLSYWFGLLRIAPLSQTVAICTRSILEEDPMFLTTKTHCTVRLLYRSYLFNFLSKILSSLQTCDESLRDNHLLVLITLSQSVPKGLIKEDHNVATVVSQATLSSDPAILRPALDLLRTIMEEKSRIFTDNITTLIPALLRLVTLPESLHIRKSALQCIFQAGFYPTHLILPYKRQVVKSLLVALDDRKRMVRAEAVKARSRWCLVGAVGEDILLS